MALPSPPKSKRLFTGSICRLFTGEEIKVMNNVRITTIEFTEKFIKVLQADKGKKTKLIYLNVREMTQNSDQALTENIVAAMSACRKKTGYLVGIFPRRWVTMRQLLLPSQIEPETRHMIAFEVDRYIPYPREDIVYDYIFLNKEANGHSKVLIIIIKKDILTRYLKILAGARLHPNRITISSQGLAAFDNHIGGTGQPLALLQIESSQSEICFCQEGKLLFSRSINFGSDDLSVESRAEFMKEIILTFHAYQREKMGEEVCKILILAAGQDMVSLRDQLIDQTGTPVEILNPWQGLSCQSDLELPLIDSDKKPTTGLGLILDNTNHGTNLLSAEFNDLRDKKSQNKELGVCCILLLILTMMNVFTSGSKYYRNFFALNHLTEELKHIEPKAQKTEKEIEQLRFMQERSAYQFFMTGFIAELYRQTPIEVSFNSLNVNRGSFVLEGVAKIGPYLNDFQNNLARSSLIKEVVLQYATKRKIFNEAVTFFKINGQIVK